MGCDIHSVGQVKISGKWKTVLQDVAGDNRNYDTFGALANVRNGYGFAGCDTGDGMLPLSVEPRGYPEDFAVDRDDSHPIPERTPTGDTYEWADPEYRKNRLREVMKATTRWMGDHSHSWASLKELKAHAEVLKTKTTQHRGFVSEKVYKALKPGEAPREYCGGISGGNVQALGEADYKAGKAEAGKDVYIKIGWTVNQYEETDLKQIIEDLEALAKKYKRTDDDVRMVFGFDS